MENRSTASLQRFVLTNAPRFLGQTAGRTSALVQMWIGAGFVLAGTVFAETFTPGERRDASDKSSSAARHLAARWAAKEAVIKAWSGSRFSQRPVLREDIHRDIEVITDMWGRPKVRLTGDIAKHLKDVTIHVQQAPGVNLPPTFDAAPPASIR